MVSSIHPKEKGEISEAFIIAHYMEAGFGVSRPCGDNLRYDLIVDDGDTLHRVQCKTGILKMALFASLQEACDLT